MSSFTDRTRGPEYVQGALLPGGPRWRPCDAAQELSRLRAQTPTVPIIIDQIARLEGSGTAALAISVSTLGPLNSAMKSPDGFSTKACVDPVPPNGPGEANPFQLILEKLPVIPLTI